jgi:hypothetical protein
MLAAMRFASQKRILRKTRNSYLIRVITIDRAQIIPLNVAGQIDITKLRSQFRRNFGLKMGDRFVIILLDEAQGSGGFIGEGLPAFVALDRVTVGDRGLFVFLDLIIAERQPLMQSEVEEGDRAMTFGRSETIGQLVVAHGSWGPA